MATPWISLLTDFGRTDTYVGQMHAVIASIAPAARVIDLTHDVSPQNILQGAVMLEDAVEAFPPGTIHVVVVDPGVGSPRRGIAAEIGPWTFVGPDNGVFTAVLDRWPQGNAVELTERRFQRETRSATFHGRDIFSPAAAHLASGVSIRELGSRLSQPLQRIPVPKPQREGCEIIGEVLWIDHFGNLITNLRQTDINSPAGHVSVGTTTEIPVVNCYADARSGDLLALFGSSGRLEIAVRDGSAAERLSIPSGSQIQWRDI